MVPLCRRIPTSIPSIHPHLKPHPRSHHPSPPQTSPSIPPSIPTSTPHRKIHSRSSPLTPVPGPVPGPVPVSSSTPRLLDSIADWTVHVGRQQCFEEVALALSAPPHHQAAKAPPHQRTTPPTHQRTNPPPHPPRSTAPRRSWRLRSLGCFQARCPTPGRRVVRRVVRYSHSSSRAYAIRFCNATRRR